MKNRNTYKWREPFSQKSSQNNPQSTEGRRMKFNNTRIHCPQCGSEYEVEPEIFDSREKIVCASCSHSWRASIALEKYIQLAYSNEFLKLSWICLIFVAVISCIAPIFSPLLLLLCIIYTKSYREVSNPHLSSVKIKGFVMQIYQKRSQRKNLMVTGWCFFALSVFIFLFRAILLLSSYH